MPSYRLAQGRRGRGARPRTRSPATSPGAATGSSSSATTARSSSSANVERLTDVTWRIRQALDRRGHHRRRRRPRSTTSSCSARRQRPEPTAATSSSAPARPTTARPAAPAPAPSSPAWSPTASCSRGEVWRQESIIGSVFEGSVEGRGRQGHPAHPRLGLRHRRGDAASSTRTIRSRWGSGHEHSHASRRRHRRRRDRRGLRLLPVAARAGRSRSSTRATSARAARTATAASSAPATSCRWPSPARSATRLKVALPEELAVRHQAALRPGALGAGCVRFARALQRRATCSTAGRAIQPLLKSSRRSTTN